MLILHIALGPTCSDVGSYNDSVIIKLDFDVKSCFDRIFFFIASKENTVPSRRQV